jgi:hypothetical protein
MRTLLTMCTLVVALASARPSTAAGASGIPGGLAGAADVGFLDVSSDPPAHILIDDADTKAVTPQPHLELKVGHHKLTLVTLDGARKRSMGFNVESGQTTKLSIHLSP